MITFNGVTKVISFDTSTTSVDVQDIYSRWVDWILTSDNSKYLPAIRAIGGDPLPGGKALGLTYFLLNGWKIKPYEESHTLTVNGNLYSEDGSNPFIDTVGDYQVMVISSVSNLVDSVSSGSSGLTTEEHDKLMGMSDSGSLTPTQEEQLMKTLTLAKFIALK